MNINILNVDYAYSYLSTYYIDVSYDVRITMRLDDKVLSNAEIAFFNTKGRGVINLLTLEFKNNVNFFTI